MDVFSHIYFVDGFFFNDTATTEIYTLSLHDALPILTKDSLPTVVVRVRPGLQLTRSDLSEPRLDRKSTRLNSSHLVISYAVFCLKKKKDRDVGLSPTITKKKYRTLA